MNKTENTIVSIIIPAYNYGMFLSECLNSVLAQTYSQWECIIIDNGSTDNTTEVAQSFVSKDPRFQYHFTEQKGVSFARNLAVSLSKGEFIFPLDADDKIAPSCLQKAIAIMKQDSGLSLVYCDAQLFGATSGTWKLPPYSFRELLKENSIFCSALFRKSDFLKAGGYNVEMVEGFEDWDFWIRMLKNGEKVYKIPEELFYYRIRENSRNSSLDKDKQIRLRKKIVANHRELYQANFDLAELIFENYVLNHELRSMKSSMSLKLGKKMLAPLLFLKKLFK